MAEILVTEVCARRLAAAGGSISGPRDGGRSVTQLVGNEPRRKRAPP